MSDTLSDIRNLSDDLVLADLISRSNRNGQKHNFIVVKDPATGAVLQTRRNLVVRRGREFNLRKIFHIPAQGDTLDILNKRSINLFGIGSGGAPGADPFNPIAPTPTDIGLNKEVAFRTVPTGTQLSAEDRLKYFDKRTIGGNDLYFKKAFSSKDIIMDDVKDDYYVKLTLDITDQDARGGLISELSLFSSIFDNSNYTLPQIATRVTFQTEALSAETNKGLVIEYYVYA